MGSLPENWESDNFSTVDRRALLRGLGTAALATSAGALFALPVWAQPTFSAYPFSLGVVSGTVPDGRMSTRKSLVVESGKPAIVEG
jgi:hypothetical protein